MTDRLKEIVDDTLQWAGELSEAWAGTTTGRVIDAQKDSLEQSVESGDMKLASILVLDLAQTCIHVDEEQNEHETS